MTLNKIPKLREPKGPVVQEVRDKFLEQEYKQNQDQFYQQDIRHIENMDFLLQRFVIMQRKDVDASVKMVSEVLRWRKQRRVYELRDEHFAQELALSGAAFPYEPDKFGNKTIYMRACMGNFCTELKPAMKEYLCHLMMQIDDPKDGSCFAIVLDLTKTSWSNYDLEMLTFLLSLLKDYFPVNLDYVLAINFPWILSTAWALVKHLIPTEKRGAVQFINSDKIFDYIPKENCPEFLGGTCARPHSRLYEANPTAIDYMIHESGGKISNKRLREILVQFKDLLPESQYEKLKKQIELYKSGQYVTHQVYLSEKLTKATHQLKKNNINNNENNNNGEVQDLNQNSSPK